jgi:hypothetical protein
MIYETWLRSRTSHILLLVSVAIVPWSVASRAVNHILSVEVLVRAAQYNSALVIDHNRISMPEYDLAIRVVGDQLSVDVVLCLVHCSGERYSEC